MQASPPRYDAVFQQSSTTSQGATSSVDPITGLYLQNSNNRSALPLGVSPFSSLDPDGGVANIDSLLTAVTQQQNQYRSEHTSLTSILDSTLRVVKSQQNELALLRGEFVYQKQQQDLALRALAKHFTEQNAANVEKLRQEIQEIRNENEELKSNFMKKMDGNFQEFQKDVAARFRKQEEWNNIRQADIHVLHGKVSENAMKLADVIEDDNDDDGSFQLQSSTINRGGKMMLTKVAATSSSPTLSSGKSQIGTTGRIPSSSQLQSGGQRNGPITNNATTDFSGLNLRRKTHQASAINTLSDRLNTLFSLLEIPDNMGQLLEQQGSTSLDKVRLAHTLPAFNVLWGELFRLAKKTGSGTGALSGSPTDRSWLSGQSPFAQNTRHCAVFIPGLGADVTNNIDKQIGGAVVERVVRGGPAEVAGISVGDTIVGVQDFAPEDPFQLADYIKYNVEGKRGANLTLRVIPVGRSSVRPLAIRLMEWRD